MRPLKSIPEMSFQQISNAGLAEMAVCSKVASLIGHYCYAPTYTVICIVGKHFTAFIAPENYC